MSPMAAPPTSSPTARWSCLNHPPADDPDDHDERLVFLGDDRNGVALEIVAVEGVTGELLIIHAQKLRAKNRAAYQRVMGYQT